MTSRTLATVALLTAGCRYHVNHEFLTSDRPVTLDATRIVERVDDERCREFFLGIPLQPLLSPADHLQEVAGNDVIVRLGIEERVLRAPLYGRRCHRITGYRMTAIPEEEPIEAVVQERPPRDAIVGWPTMPLGAPPPAGTDVPSGGEVAVEPADVAGGFLGMDVSDVVVTFVDGVAQRASMVVPPGAGRRLTLAWGAPAVERDGRYRWTDEQVEATLDGRTLSFARSP